MSTTTSSSNNNNTISTDNSELTLEIPVWVQGKRKWVTGITKKTTFDDLIYALLAQADLLKSNSSSTTITGYAIAECIQLTGSSSTNNDVEPTSLITQRLIKGRGKVMKSYKNWQFNKLPLTILHLISTSTLNETNSSTSKFRSKIFRRFLSSKTSLPSLLSTSQSDSSLTSIGNTNFNQTFLSYRQKSLNDFHDNFNTIERQKRLLEYLDDKIHQAENHSIHSYDSTTCQHINEVTFADVSNLFSHSIDQQDQLLFVTQLCNSIFNMQERIDEKTNILYAVEQAISNELNHVLHQQHYDTIPTNTFNETNSSSTISNDLLTLKNSIYRSRELSRIQSKEMHDLDLSLREIEILLSSKYDELKSLEYETSSNILMTSRCQTPICSTQQIYRTNFDEQSNYDTLDNTPSTNVAFNSIKEIDEDSGINSLTSDDSNQHLIILSNQKFSTQNSSQLETLV